MRPKKFIRSPVSGWNAESTRCFACHRSSMDKLDTLPCLTRNQEWIHVQWKTSYQQQLVAFNKASKGWLKKVFYRTGSLAPRLTPHLEAVGITLLLVYAVVPQSFLPKETIQCGGAWTRPTENNMLNYSCNQANLIFPHRWLVRLDFRWLIFPNSGW